MKQFFIPILLLLFYACNHKQAPTSFDCKCPNERVKFPKDVIDPNPQTTFLDSVSKPIVLTEDSSFIGIWFSRINYDSYVDLYYSKNNKLYEKGYGYYIFQSLDKMTTPRYVREKKIFIINDIYWMDRPGLDSITYYPKFIGSNSNMLYALSNNSYTVRRPIDSLTQPFAERQEFIDFCEKADTNTLAWYVGGGALVRWYKKDGIDYLMHISGLGYTCKPIKLKKKWFKDYQVINYVNNEPSGYYISKDSSSYYILTGNGKDTLSYSYGTTPQQEKENNYLENYSFYDQYFFYYIFDYKGIYVPD